MDGEIAPDAVDKAMRFAMATMEVALATMGLPTPDEPDRRDQAIADLRAVLAPLLERPFIRYGPRGVHCVFCRAGFSQWPKRRSLATIHAPGCAVLRRDELLGR